ncbi:MAG TPA: hypothetical protein VHR46_01040 [Gaiella sp.]|nr:hypothetical protein [Gaiella sp.]
MPIETAGDRQLWETRLAAVKEELASGQVESLSDVLRLGEKVLTAAGIDIGAHFDAIANEAKPPARPASPRSRSTILRAQGAYYVLSGLWAVVDRRGFEGITGRKADYWLVRTVGLLAATIGSSLLAGTRAGRPSTETTVLGVAAGVSFTAVDLVYVARRRISPVYLGDAAVHGLFAGFALLGELRRESSRG